MDSEKLSKGPEAFLQFLNSVLSDSAQIIQLQFPLSSLHCLSYGDPLSFLVWFLPEADPSTSSSFEK